MLKLCFSYKKDQRYETSISEYPQGRWHESFEFTVTYHNQLFDTVQLDLYDSYLLLPDKHVGRAEIRLKNLRGMPDVFTSYYEIWDKKLSSGASSRVGRAKTMATNVGALQAKIHYIYQSDTADDNDERKHGASSPFDLSEGDIGKTPRRPSYPANRVVKRRGMTDEKLADEFRQHVKQQREAAAIQFRKYAEDEKTLPLEDGLDYPDESDGNSSSVSDAGGDLGIRQPLALSKKRTTSAKLAEQNGQKHQPKLVPSRSLGTTPANHTVRTRPVSGFESAETSVVLEDEDEDGLKSFPLLSTIGSWTLNKETNNVLRAIGKMLAAFGQGFELSNIQIIQGFAVLEKFYTDLPRDRTWDVVEDLSEIDLPAYFWKYSVASYGWKGLNFIGKGNGYISDAMRNHSDSLSIIEHLSIPKEDLLAYEFRSAKAFRPSYFIARDRNTNSIVLCIRGTMSAFDTMTDLVCEYEQWRGGLVHKGMKSSAMWFFRHVAPQLVAYCNEHSTNSLYIVGHSLGAATAAILTIMLLDFVDEFRKDKTQEFTLKCFGYAPACGMSLDLSERYKDHITSVVFADDVVSKLSYGSMMDVKELVIASCEAAQNLGIGQLLWSDKPEGKQWEKAFERISDARQRCLDSMENPRV
ncbi:hypothetical protein BX666DRAFT_1858941 [Dichotomocladium elegans]|nr:hypothetical protein BX666DRAFT_1858941 [Dichotomocladium elegans]